MLDNKKRNKDKDQVENNKESELLKDAIKEVFEHALLEKNISEDRFNEVIKNKNLFLEIFSPWHKEDEDGGLIKNFVDQIDKQDFAKDFSWLNILDKDRQWEESGVEEIKKEVKDKSKHVNMRYQIPTHFHGDIDNAVIFHCMENPRGYLGSYGDNQIDSGFGETNLKEYYGKSYKLLNEDNSKRKTIKKIKSILRAYSEDKDVKEIIQERYQLEENAKEEISIEHIKKIIYSDTESALGREINHIYRKNKSEEFCNFDFENEEQKSKTVLLKDYYYLKEYYSHLIQTNQKLDFKKLKGMKGKVTAIAKKICNLEIYPFSCAQPKLAEEGVGENILLHSNLSRLGAYIILRRIYMYLSKEKHTEKPIFVFRKYNIAWEKLFSRIFSKITTGDYNTKEVMKILEKKFFYCQLRPVGGGITSGNVISVPNYNKYLELKSDSLKNELELGKKYKKWKEEAFKEISDLLPRIDIDKINVKESGNE
ncbi:hypothetical protein [Gemella sanguinis]|uniref:hypothetical protein n=1 Tax=Gemella sanguinis TaxID=84135 RepID=UPI0004E146B5|nr:hypothetical protein [Gemella sanguinis]NKZ25563.1 hypothetical protein [Gemella sanguinis]